MRVFLDTNVIVSAVTTRVLCADIFRAVLVDHELVTCPKVLQEVRRVLRAKFSVPEQLVSDYLNLLRRDLVVAEAGDVPHIQLRDRDDVETVAGAVAAQAHVLVTGDGELQKLKSIRG